MYGLRESIRNLELFSKNCSTRRRIKTFETVLRIGNIDRNSTQSIAHGKRLGPRNRRASENHSATRSPVRGVGNERRGETILSQFLLR
jgi:hypothetical protein